MHYETQNNNAADPKQALVTTDSANSSVPSALLRVSRDVTLLLRSRSFSRFKYMALSDHQLSHQ